MNSGTERGEIEGAQIGIGLTDEAGKVVVLEIGWEKKASELRRVPNDEAGVGGAPQNGVIGIGRFAAHNGGTEDRRSGYSVGRFQVYIIECAIELLI
ncbi:hypothetical protein SESBI_41627 [Sesbania bispinosa]|nr:hypothetical protein SESBI_41627 [Sesbania bispinosa]